METRNIGTKSCEEVVVSENELRCDVFDDFENLSEMIRNGKFQEVGKIVLDKTVGSYVEVDEDLAGILVNELLVATLQNSDYQLYEKLMRQIMSSGHRIGFSFSVMWDTDLYRYLSLDVFRYLFETRVVLCQDDDDEDEYSGGLAIDEAATLHQLAFDSSNWRIMAWLTAWLESESFEVADRFVCSEAVERIGFDEGLQRFFHIHDMLSDFYKGCSRVPENEYFRVLSQLAEEYELLGPFDTSPIAVPSLDIHLSLAERMLLQHYCTNSELGCVEDLGSEKLEALCGAIESIESLGMTESASFAALKEMFKIPTVSIKRTRLI